MGCCVIFAGLYLLAPEGRPVEEVVAEHLDSVIKDYEKSRRWEDPQHTLL